MSPILVYALVSILWFGGDDGPPFPSASPGDVGVDPAPIEDLVETIAELVEAGDPIGAELLIIKDRKTIRHEVFGWRDRERKLPVVPNTICRIRSMTKPIVATALFELIEQDEISLDDHVAEYLPSFDNERSGAITIDHLLTHTGGFGHPGYPEQPMSYASLRDAVDASGEKGPKDPVGSLYRYSDVDSATIASLVAELREQSAEEVIQERVFDVLSMKDTFCHYSPEDPRASRVSATYNSVSQKLEKYWDPSEEQVMAYFRGSGGIYSTPMDYARFLTFWMEKCPLDDGHFLSEGLVDKVLTSIPMSVRITTREAVSRHYARHFEILGSPRTEQDIKENGLPVFGHSGSDGTLGFASPQRNMIILYFTQSRGSSTLGIVFNKVANLLSP